MRDFDGDTPLNYAAMNNLLPTMKLLVRRGSEINAVNRKGCTVLHGSVYQRDPDAVAFILEVPGINVNVQDNNGDTPLHEAINRYDPAVLNLLCTHPEVDFSLTNRRGYNGLHLAASRGNIEAVRLIVPRARNLVDAPKEDGSNPLLLACKNGRLDCVVYLLDDALALPDHVDNRGRTAIGHAVQTGSAAVIEAIMSRYGGSVTKKLINREDVDGNSSMHIAFHCEGEPRHPVLVNEAPAIFQFVEKAERFGVPRKLVHSMAIAAYLITKGGKMYIKNRQGLTALEHVCDPIAKAFLLDVYTQHKADDLYPRAVPVARARPEASPAAGATSVTPSPQPAAPSPAECRICCENLPRVIFEPCGHRIVCGDCAKRMKKCIECDVVLTGKIYPSNCSAAKSDQQNQLLAAKVQDYEEKYLCSICMENQKSIVFLCGHGACAACSDTIKMCHMCRTTIKQRIIMY